MSEYENFTDAELDECIEALFDNGASHPDHPEHDALQDAQAEYEARNCY